jgi:hypothetical protein
MESLIQTQCQHSLKFSNNWIIYLSKIMTCMDSGSVHAECLCNNSVQIEEFSTVIKSYL